MAATVRDNLLQQTLLCFKCTGQLRGCIGTASQSSRYKAHTQVRVTILINWVKTVKINKVA